MNIKIITHSNSKGFSLIEVLIALLILSFGILAIAKLQGVMIKNSSNANQRTTAVSIAQQKIDDLKSFAHLTVAESITEPNGDITEIPDTWTSGLAARLLAYEHISGDSNLATFTEKGGQISPGTTTVGQTTYTLNWSVTDYWYDTALSTATTTEPTNPTPSTSDYKMVAVIVSWTDEVGDDQTISLNTAIDSYRPALTSYSDNSNSTGDVGPKANYTPLPAPDVVPVSLESGGTKFKETSVPEPEVTKQDYATVVDFETVTYSNLNIALRREQFVTAACSCSRNTSGSLVEHEYGYLKWDAEEKQFIDAVYSVRNYHNDDEDFAGSDSINECVICCRDGQYKVADPDDENIAQDQTFGFSDVDQGTSGQVDKICRLKKIDGIYRVVKPWKLIGFNIMPASYFDSSQTSSSSANITAYSSYVESVVRDALGVNSSSLGTLDAETDKAGPTANANQYIVSTAFTNTAGADSGYNAAAGGDATGNHNIINQGNNNAERTIQARAIYLDLPPSGYLDNPEGTSYTAANVPLDRIPFYETNVTSLTGWIPDEDQTNFGDIATNYTEEHDTAVQGNAVRDACQSSNISTGISNCVSNQELTNKTYGDYERGKFYPYSVQSDSVTARYYSSNDGLANETVNSESSVDASITITVQ